MWSAPSSSSRPYTPIAFHYSYIAAPPLGSRYFSAVIRVTPLKPELTDATCDYRTPTTNQRPAQLPTHQVQAYRNHSTSHPHVPAANSPPVSRSASKPPRPPKPQIPMPRTHQLSRLLIHYLKSRPSSSLLPQLRKPNCVKPACTSATTKADSAALLAAMRTPRTRSLSSVARTGMRVGSGVDRVPLRRNRDDRWTTRTMLLMLEGTAAAMTMTSNWSRSSRGGRVDVAMIAL